MKFNELEKKIIKEKSLITCDNKNCEYRGEMRYCYLDLHKHCPIYLDYRKTKDLYINKNID